MKPHRQIWKKVFQTFIHITKSSFHTFVGGALTPVIGGSGVLDIGNGTAGLVLSIKGILPFGPAVSNKSLSFKRNQFLCIPASLRSPSIRPCKRYCIKKYSSLNRHGMRPRPVTQKRALRICESISSHIRLGEFMSSQVGWHIAGAALTRSKKSIPPHATTLRQ